MILIDVDGTLVDSVPDLSFCVDRMMQQLALPERGEQAVRCWVGNGVERLVKRALIDQLEGDHQVTAAERPPGTVSGIPKRRDVGACERVVLQFVGGGVAPLPKCLAVRGSVGEPGHQQLTQVQLVPGATVASALPQGHGPVTLARKHEQQVADALENQAADPSVGRELAFFQGSIEYWMGQAESSRRNLEEALKEAGLRDKVKTMVGGAVGTSRWLVRWAPLACVCRCPLSWADNHSRL